MTLNTKKNAVISIGQTAISGLLLFLVYKHLTGALGIEALGLWAIIIAITSAIRLSEMGLSTILSTIVAGNLARGETEEASINIQSVFFFTLFAISTFSALAFLVSGPLLEFFLPIASNTDAALVFPYALISLVLASAGGVFQSALDGCHRIDLRNILIFFANAGFSLLVFILPVSLGLLGLIGAQVVQNIVLLAGGWLLLRREIRSLPILPNEFSLTRILRIFRSAATYQLNSIAGVLFEPATKLLISRYGGLVSAGHYELASQIVIKVRALAIAGNQAIVPSTAALSAESPDSARALYVRYHGVTVAAVSISFGFLVAALPAASFVFLKRIDSEFYAMGVLLCLAWGINSLSAPAYFFNQGVSNLSANVFQNAIQTSLNLLTGVLLGSLFGPVGVVVGTLFSLTVGSMYLVKKVHMDNSIADTANTLGDAKYVGVIAVIAAVLVSIVFYMFPQYLDNAPMAATLLLLYPIFLLPAARHCFSIYLGRRP